MFSKLASRRRRILWIYIALVLGSLAFGLSGGPMGVIFTLPFLLPWSVLVPVLDRSLGTGFLQVPGVGPALLIVEGLLNISLLYLALRYGSPDGTASGKGRA